MLLAHLLARADVDCVVLERRDRAYVEKRVRAGVLEPLTAEILGSLELDERLRHEGLIHTGINLAYDGETFRVDLSELSGGPGIFVYGQQEVMKDLFDAAEARGLHLIWNAEDVALHDIASEHPWVTWRIDGAEQRLECDFIAGCDGSHGVSLASIPAEAVRTYERVYPFGWLGVLAEV